METTILTKVIATIKTPSAPLHDPLMLKDEMIKFVRKFAPAMITEIDGSPYIEIDTSQQGLIVISFTIEGALSTSQRTQLGTSLTRELEYLVTSYVVKSVTVT